MSQKFSLFASILNTLVFAPQESEAGGEIEWVPQEGTADRGTVVRCWDGEKVEGIKQTGLGGRCVTFLVYVGIGYVELFTTTPTEGWQYEDLVRYVKENGLRSV